MPGGQSWQQVAQTLRGHELVAAARTYVFRDDAPYRTAGEDSTGSAVED